LPSRQGWLSVVSFTSENVEFIGSLAAAFRGACLVSCCVSDCDVPHRGSLFVD